VLKLMYTLVAVGDWEGSKQSDQSSEALRTSVSLLIRPLGVPASNFECARWLFIKTSDKACRRGDLF
jgi:hypothetical protein